MPAAPEIRPTRADENDEILAVVNAAAEAYRGVIPADRWHQPYMAAEELDRELASGVQFWAIDFYERNGFELVSEAEKDRLLREYWSIPERQVETSVVLRAATPTRSSPGASS